MVHKQNTTMQPAPQDNQLMSKHRVLSLKPQLRLEWPGQNAARTLTRNRATTMVPIATMGGLVSLFGLATGRRRAGMPRSISLDGASSSLSENNDASLDERYSACAS
jgi:hypothetical protein